MRRAFLAGDGSYDGVFFTGVKTTGIFCRPSCTARKPRPENVEFFATPREALFSGYRARRYFQKHYGMTFQAYCRARRLGDAFRQIKGGSTVSDVATASGFESESGFRAAFGRAFGAAPSEAAAGDTVLLDWIASTVGPLVAAPRVKGSACSSSVTGACSRRS